MSGLTREDATSFEPYWSLLSISDTQVWGFGKTYARTAQQRRNETANIEVE